MAIKTVNNPRLVFFGTPEVAVSILEELKKSGLTPGLVVTTPDKNKGRGLILTPSPVKIWAQKHDIDILQPEKLDNEFINQLKKNVWNLFIVVAYGKIIPKEILDIPTKGSLNIHYSLLPKLRGSSPVEGAILSDERETGVSIILMDEKMDHGPIIAQKKVVVLNWPPTRSDLMDSMNKVAGKLLIETLPRWINGELTQQEQDHSKATYIKIIKKEDALIDLKDDDYLNFKKIMAYERWPRAYFIKDGKRIIVNSARCRDGKLEILRITPEGKKEMDYKNDR